MNTAWTPWKILSATLGVGVLTEHWNLADLPPESTDKHRTFDVKVEFAAPFMSPPVVQIGLTGFDLDQRHGARIAIAAKDITVSGFTVQISTWRETRVYSAEFTWMAIGA